MRRFSLLRHTLLFSLFLGTAFCTVLFAQPGPEDSGYDPSLVDYENLAATLLAEDIKHKYGGENWTDSLSFSFDFVAYNNTHEELVRYHNEWNRLTGEALLSSTLSDGRPYEVKFSNFNACIGTMTVDSVAVPEAHLKDALRKAYDRLKNNIRWLLTPVQLLDSDIKIQLLNDSVIDGKQITPMKVNFNDSISSASDAFIYINTNYKNIERWRVNYDGVYREYIWRLTRRIGPFLFATRLWADDFKTYIQLERIKVTSLKADAVAQNDTKSK